MKLIQKMIMSFLGSKRKLILTAALIAIIAGFSVYSMHFHSDNKQAVVPQKSSTKIIIGKLTPPVTDKYEANIQLAQDYLKRTLVTPSNRLILDYLQRRYGLYGQFSAVQNPIGYPKPGQHDDPVEFPAFRRFSYPNELIRKVPDAGGDGIAKMMMAAANCDHIPLPTSFRDLVQSNIKAGGYNVTHVAFSLQRMKENNCHYFTSAQTQLLVSEVTTDMTGLVIKPDTIPDLRYEAIAFLLDLGRKDLVPEAWISQIAAEQQPSGGWKVQADELDKGDDHATVLALWALLGYTRPDAPQIPMIRKPTTIKYLPPTDKQTKASPQPLN